MEPSTLFYFCFTLHSWICLRYALFCAQRNATQQQTADRKAPDSRSLGHSILVKRLPTPVASCKAPGCAAEGLLSLGIQQFEALVSAADGIRKISKSILDDLASLEMVIVVAKACLRYLPQSALPTAHQFTHGIDYQSLHIRTFKHFESIYDVSIFGEDTVQQYDRFLISVYIWPTCGTVVMLPSGSL